MDYVALYQDDSGEWRWRRVAPNGEPVGASTEGYTRWAACMENAVRINGHVRPDGDDPDKCWVSP